MEKIKAYLQKELEKGKKQITTKKLIEIIEILEETDYNKNKEGGDQNEKNQKQKENGP